MSQRLSFELQDVCVQYAAQAALSHVDLVIAPGERVALIGPSGAGKTTLLGLLNGTVRPTVGRVLAEGRDIATLSSGELRTLRARIGFVYQDHCLVPNLRVAQNVLAGGFGRRGFLGALRAMTWPPRAELERAAGILERVGIGDKLFQRTDRLSGGERQRTAIARALYQEPGALLADEPVSSVDPARARDTVALLCELSAERGLTLLTSLHDVRLAREFFPRLVGLRGGRIEFDACTRDVDEDRLVDLYALQTREPSPRGRA